MCDPKNIHYQQFATVHGASLKRPYRSSKDTVDYPNKYYLFIIIHSLLEEAFYCTFIFYNFHFMPPQTVVSEEVLCVPVVPHAVRPLSIRLLFMLRVYR